MSLPAGLLALSPEEGARRVALSYLDQAAAAFPRLADPADAEALHDFRVGLRRLRSALRAYRPHLDDSLPKKLLRRLRDLAAATGPGRDTEVQIEWLRGRSRHLSGHHRAGLAWLLARLEERMLAANAEMADLLPREFPRVEKDLRGRLSTYHTEVQLGSGAKRPTLGDATADVLHLHAAELESQLARVEDERHQEEAHEARISAKRLRYLLEPFTAELDEAARVVKRLKGIQELLGELHDAHVLELELAAAVEAAAVERSRRLLDAALAATPDEAQLRAERRRPQEPGLLALARLNRARRDRLFQELDEKWLAGRGAELFEEVARLEGRLRGEEVESGPHPDIPPQSPSPDLTPAPAGRGGEQPVEGRRAADRRPRFM